MPMNRQHTEDELFREKLDMHIGELGLSVRTINMLTARNIETVRDLLNTKRADLLAIKNFGEKALEEVLQSVEAIGFVRVEKRR